MSAMSEEEEDLLLSCLMSVASSPPYIYPHMPQGRGAEVAREEGKVPRRRQRRKARGEGEGSSSEAKKRRLTDKQASLLEISFSTDRKLESERKNQLAAELGLDPKQVAVWFQNRRSRLKSKQLEEELFHLKSAHDQAILAKCELEKEVLILKEKLYIAEAGMKKLTTTGTSGGNGERGGGEGSPCSSLCTGTYQPLLGEFEVEGGVHELLYLSDYNSMLDWVNFYGF